MVSSISSRLIISVLDSRLGPTESNSLYLNGLILTGAADEKTSR
jgi:hypothetical protein